MASGRTHARVAATVLLAGSVGSVLLILYDDSLTAPVIPLLTGLVNGYLVTPDIDIDHMTEEEKRWESIPIIGQLVRVVFSTFWYPYALFFGHRGISHWHFVGTATRIGYQYLGFLIWSITIEGWQLWFQGQPWPLVQAIASLPWEWIGLHYIGWLAQDEFHLLWDWKIWTRQKRRRGWGCSWQGILILSVLVLILYLIAQTVLA